MTCKSTKNYKKTQDSSRKGSSPEAFRKESKKETHMIFSIYLHRVTLGRRDSSEQLLSGEYKKLILPSHFCDLIEIICHKLQLSSLTFPKRQYVLLQKNGVQYNCQRNYCKGCTRYKVFPGRENATPALVTRQLPTYSPVLDTSY